MELSTFRKPLDHLIESSAQVGQFVLADQGHVRFQITTLRRSCGSRGSFVPLRDSDGQHPHK